jgi:hypothetical protein
MPQCEMSCSGHVWRTCTCSLPWQKSNSRAKQRWSRYPDYQYRPGHGIHRYAASYFKSALASCLSSIFVNLSSSTSPFPTPHFRLSIQRMASARPKSRKRRDTRPPSTSTRRPATAELDSDYAVPPPLLKNLQTLENESGPHTLETLPVEVVNQILSYLIHPRSRLPGLTESQSNFDYSSAEQRRIRDAEDPTTPPDADRPFSDVFAMAELRHPLHVLAATSKRCRELVESYSAHLVKTCNMFHLPFDHMEAHGPHSVYPDLRHIVYRRLWLQTTSRHCVFCGGNLCSYPHKPVMRVALMLTCEECFYAQVLVSMFVLEFCYTSRGSRQASFLRGTDRFARRSKRYRDFTMFSTLLFSPRTTSAAPQTTSGPSESTWRRWL